MYCAFILFILPYSVETWILKTCKHWKASARGVCRSSWESAGKTSSQAVKFSGVQQYHRWLSYSASVVSPCSVTSHASRRLHLPTESYTTVLALSCGHRPDPPWNRLFCKRWINQLRQENTHSTNFWWCAILRDMDMVSRQHNIPLPSSITKYLFKFLPFPKANIQFTHAPVHHTQVKSFAKWFQYANPSVQLY